MTLVRIRIGPDCSFVTVRPLRRYVDADGIWLAQAETVQLIAGAVTTALDPTAGAIGAWVITEHNGTTRCVSVPTDTGATLDYELLQDVDPGTFEPSSPEALAGWTATLAAVESAAELAGAHAVEAAASAVTAASEAALGASGAVAGSVAAAASSASDAATSATGAAGSAGAAGASATGAAASESGAALAAATAATAALAAAPAVVTAATSAAGTAVAAAITAGAIVGTADARLPQPKNDEDVAFTIVGATGRRSWVEIGNDGHPTVNSAALIDAATAPAEIARTAAAIALVPIPLPIEIGSGVIYAVTDSAGRGSWLQVGPDGHPTAATVAMLQAAGLGAAVVPDGSLTEAKFDPALAARVPQSSVLLDAMTPANRGLAVRDALGNTRSWVSDPAVIACWGDSLTAGWPVPEFTPATNSYPAVLDSLYAGGSTFNGGYQGQTADEIALRQGGMVLMVSVTGGSIPASGGVDVTTTQSFGWNVAHSWQCNARIGGVDGSLSRAATTTTFTFTRTASGSAVAVPGVVPVLSLDGDTYKNNVQVIMIGRNDVGLAAPAGVINRTVTAYAATAQYLCAVHARFLLLGTLTATTEGRGTPTYILATGINAALAKLFPNNFFDLRAYLVNQCISDLGITPTADDLVKIAADTLPPSIMSAGGTDGIHYSPAAAAKVALQVYNQLNTRGWLL